MNQLIKQTGFHFESIRGWRTVYATDNYIYIALNGTKDLETRIEKLSVFDWQGLPIK